jgi:hypothetical protein
MRSALTVWIASDSERIAHIYSYDGSAFIVALERMKPPVLEWVINAATLDAATSAADVWFGSEREPVSWSMYETDAWLSLDEPASMPLSGTAEPTPPARYSVIGLPAGRSATILRDDRGWRVEMSPGVDLPATNVPSFERPEQALLFIEALRRLPVWRRRASDDTAPWKP